MKHFKFLTAALALLFAVSADPEALLFEDGKTYEPLCTDAENDQVGQKLGCSCTFVSTYLMANCGSLSVKLGPSSLPLPERLNISSQVRILDMSSNVLEEITGSTFDKIDGLDEINFSKNRITKFENLNAPLLKKLDLSYNKITNLTKEAFAKTKKLNHLDLSHNQLTFIHPEAFTQLDILVTLKLGFNELENLKNEVEGVYPFNLTDMQYLEELDLTNGSLVDFPVWAIKGSVRLRKLVLANNLFSLLPENAFDALPGLEILDLSGNLFMHLPPNGFAQLHHLIELSLDRLMLERIEAHTFANLSSLDLFSCQYNFMLTEIDSAAFHGDPEANTSDSNPRLVQLNYNSLTRLDLPLLKWSQLEDLELFGNKFLCDCEMDWIPELRLKDPTHASMLNDLEFKCYAPEHLHGTPVVLANPEEMYCSSRTALFAGIVAIIISCLILFLFCAVLILNYLGLLPTFFDKYLDVFRDSRPVKYVRVQPKPNTVYEIGGSQGVESQQQQDMDWDPSDIGPYGSRLA